MTSFAYSAIGLL